MTALRNSRGWVLDAAPSRLPREIVMKRPLVSELAENREGFFGIANARFHPRIESTFLNKERLPMMPMLHHVF